jgi:hypothetical protein
MLFGHKQSSGGDKGRKTKRTTGTQKNSSEYDDHFKPPVSVDSSGTSRQSVLLYMAELNQSVAKETSLPAYRKICSYGHQTITIINDALKVLSREN